jgi:hypothetical protein
MAGMPKSVGAIDRKSTTALYQTIERKSDCVEPHPVKARKVVERERTALSRLVAVAYQAC